MRSQIIASPKLVTPPPPNIHAKQPMRFTTRVAIFTVTPKHMYCISDRNAIKCLLSTYTQTCTVQKRLESG